MITSVIESRYGQLGQGVIDKLRLRYDEYVLTLEGDLEKFLRFLEHGGFFDTSVVILSADHGEIFEKGFVGHNRYALYQPLIHVPLVIRLPGRKEGKRVSSNAEQVDLAPTILDLAGQPIPGWMEGESLRGAMERGEVTTKPKFSIHREKNGKYGGLRRGVASVVQGDYKYIYYLEEKKGELFHLVADPREEHNIAGLDRERARRLRELIETRVIRPF